MVNLHCKEQLYQRKTHQSGTIISKGHVREGERSGINRYGPSGFQGGTTREGTVADEDGPSRSCDGAAVGRGVRVEGVLEGDITQNQGGIAGNTDCGT